MKNQELRIVIGEDTHIINLKMCELPPALEMEKNIGKLNEHMAEYPGFIAWIGFLQAQAKSQVEKLNWLLETTVAELDSRIRNEESAKKVTEKSIENQIKQDADYLETKELLVNAKDTERQLKAVLDGLHAKKDSLITIASNFRSEMDSNIRINV